MNFILLGQIAAGLAQLARNPVLGNDANDLGVIFALGGLAMQQIGMSDADRQMLLEQVTRANAEGRKRLTDEETAYWESAHQDAKKIILDWRPQPQS